MKKNYIVLIISLLMLQAADGQDTTIGKVSIASPNAASLGKYGDIPVGYHTGVPQVSVPIYTIRSGSLQLPISLSYHASGLKVQEQASWVGAGWTLNAGGAITRTVVGAPDDRGINAAHTTKGHFSDYGYYSYLFSSGGGACGGTGVPCPIGSLYPADDPAIAGGVKDGEPDLYFFNFNGHTGKFYFNDDRTPILVPEEDYKITPIYPYTQSQNSLYGILGFVVTTPDGVRYYFGKNQSNDGNIDAMEITTDMTFKSPVNTQQGAVSAWFLNKIVSADGMDSINLIYQSDKLSYYGVSMFPVYPNAFNGLSTFNNNDEYDLLKNFVNGVRLSKITFANGEVDLTPGIIRQDVGDYNSQIIGDVANTQSPALGSIRITDNNGYCKRDSFYYSYFRDSTTAVAGFFSGVPLIDSIHSDKYRLRLDSVQESTCDASLQIPPYRFTYFTELVPRKLSFGIDHWGYYNGVTSNQTLIPTYTVVSTGAYDIEPGADRDAHWPAMRGGTLQKIQYPTGGSTTFEFEPHDTYVQFTKLAKSFFGGFSVGYGNATTSGSFTASGSVTYYEMDMSSSQSGSGGATLELTTTGGSFVNSWGVSSGESRNFTFTLSPGTYNWTFHDNASETMDGASASMYQFSPVTTSGNVLVGGLRIKTITTHDGVTNNNMVTSYAYTINGSGQSSGILYSRPVYVQELRNDVFKLVGAFDSTGTCSSHGCITCDGTGFTAYYKSPSSIRPMATTQGNHIGYNEVRVSQSGNGYSIYRYYGSNIWDNITDDVCTRYINVSSCNLSAPNYPAAPLPFEYLRGELKYEGHFDESGHILKDVNYFPKYIPDSVFTPGYICQYVNTGLQGSFYWGTEYVLQSAAKVKDSIITDIWDSTGPTVLTSTSISYYNSPFHHQLARKVTNTSTGDSVVMNYTYAADYRINNCDTIANGWHAYSTAYQVALDSFASRRGYCSDASTGGWNCKYVNYQQYRFDESQARQAYVNLRRTNFTDSGSRFATCLVSARNAADVLLKPILRLQDEFRNPPIELSEWRDLNLRQAAFTRYDTSVSPVGFVYPGLMQTLDLRTASSSFAPSVVSGNSITRDSRYQNEKSFLFNNGNPQQVVAHDGIPISYIWDYLHTEPIALVQNATADQVAFTSFEADGGGNWSIPSSARDTGSITGNKSYSLSHGACTRAGLTGSNSYILSYWSKTGSAFTVSGSTTVKQGKTVRGWTYFQHAVTGVTSVSVSGSGDIDELRLYPSHAQMTTYTYSPLAGMTSQCDIGNRVTYYEYDGLQRLQRVRDQDYNIIKSLDYQYQVNTGCGNACFIMTMETLAGTNTLGYPVGVFNIHEKLLGNAMDSSQYVALWNSDTADNRIGTLSAGGDALHFNLALNSGQTLPSGVTGCRYYQVDLAWNNYDGLRNSNAAYVDFGDGTGMRLPTAPEGIASLAANTTYSQIYSGEENSYATTYYVHTYADTTLKTITFYHNDDALNYHLDNLNDPATSLTKLRHLRGNLPQNVAIFGSSCFQDSSVSTVDSIYNWSSIHSITYFHMLNGDKVNPNRQLAYAQDFMRYNTGLQAISTTLGFYRNGYRDTTFKLSRLKSDWNTYFTQLKTLSINDEHWDREDLSALTQLNSFSLVATTQNHQDDTNSPLVPIPSPVLDTIVNQMARGAGQTVSNGVISLAAGGSTLTSESYTAVQFLLSKGWTIYVNGTVITNP